MSRSPNGFQSLSLFSSYDGTIWIQGKPDSWTPIPELLRVDGDLAVIFLSGADSLFIEPMDDDWYRATTPWGAIYSAGAFGELPTWRPNVSASPMGCFEQFQWCNSAYPRDRGCGPLTGSLDAIYGAAPLFNVTNETLAADRPSSSDATSARLLWPFQAIWSSTNNVRGVISSLGTRSLASQSQFFSGVQFPLPDNQWQLDVLQWFQIIMAGMQASRSDFFSFPHGLKK